MSDDHGFYGKGNPVMEVMFAAFVQRAWQQEGMRQEFEQDTRTPPLGSSGINAMVDEATGLRGRYVEGFIRWLIVNQWGEQEPRA